MISIVAFALLWALSDDADGASVRMPKTPPFCGSSVVRDYEALPPTPAMAARVSDHIWSLEEIAALLG